MPVADVGELLRNPLVLLILLPFLPLILPLVLLTSLPGSETRNEEVWEIYEDKRTGAIKVVVHRHVRRS
jgi:hypothetical protein